MILRCDDDVNLTSSRYILPTKSSHFLSSIFQHITRSPITHRHYIIDMLIIWLQFRTGAHIASNPSLFDDCMALITSTVATLPPDDEFIRSSLMSLTYNLWLYQRAENKGQITALTKVVTKFTSIMNHCTPENEVLVGVPPLFES